MSIVDIFFYLFSLVMIAAGTVVICARNMVHSVLCLILAFFNAAGLFILLRAEFIAMLLVIVYVGAVAVLFLFVVMMLDIKIKSITNYYSAMIIGAILCVEFGILAIGGLWSAYNNQIIETTTPQTESIGLVLYTKYFYPFQLSGIILLVAMIGAITLTLRQRDAIKQNIRNQIHRTRSQSIELHSLELHKGIPE